MNFDKTLVAIVVALLSLMVMVMWGRVERFDEKVAWTEDQIIQLKKEVSNGKRA